jgi:hypothetical protein
MGLVRYCACCVVIGACFVTVGCGGGGSSTTGTTAGDGATAGLGANAGGGGEGNGRRAIHEPVQSRGIKGENPSAEAATTARISAADCAKLGRLAERRLAAQESRGKGGGGRGSLAGQGSRREGGGGHGSGPAISTQSEPSPPLSRCRLSGHGVSINVYLDAGFAAHQRYANRIDETVQFNTENPAGLPQPVPHVGEKAAYNADANWIPALRSLLAVRGNRWLTVTISVAGHSNDELRDEAAALARAGFKLTAAG